MEHPRPLNLAQLRPLLREALAEDVGAGDATTLALVPAGLELRARLQTRDECVVAGLPLVGALFAELDPRVLVAPAVQDGALCPAGALLATVSGPARAILTGERTALNFLQRLSGIATLTRRYVQALAGGRTRLLDTRKTTPGLRLLEKYAVVCGGGENHRFGLFDRIMVKDNHRQLLAALGSGGLAHAVAACRAKYPDLDVEVEVDTLEQLADALAAGPDIVLLDNMADEELTDAVKLRDEQNPQVLLEASGGMTLERMPAVAATRVDFVSVGALTHSARATDIGLDFDPAGGGRA